MDLYGLTKHHAHAPLVIVFHSAISKYPKNIYAPNIRQEGAARESTCTEVEGESGTENPVVIPLNAFPTIIIHNLLIHSREKIIRNIGIL